MFIRLLFVVAAAILPISGLVGAAVGFGPLASQEPAESASARKATVDKSDKSPAKKKPIVLKDQFGYPLPAGVAARLGTTRFNHGDLICSVAISPLGKTIASGISHSLRLWDIATGKDTLLKLGDGGCRVANAVAFSPDGKILAAAQVGIGTSIVTLWELPSGKQLPAIGGQANEIQFMVFSPNGEILATASWDQTIRLWSVKTGRELFVLQGHTHWVKAIVFSPDGKKLFSGSPDKSIRVWNVETGKEISTLKTKGAPVNGLAISPDGKTLAWGTGRFSVLLHDLETGKEIRRLHKHTRVLTSLSFSRDGKSLASADEEEGFRLWDVASGKKTMPIASECDTNVEFSRHDDLLVTWKRYGNYFRLWNSKTCTEVANSFENRLQSQSLVCSSRSNTAFGLCADGAIRQWRMDTGKEIRKIQATRGKQLAMTRDEKIIITDDHRGALHAWDAATGKKLYTVEDEDKEEITRFAVSPDGILATGNFDGTIHLRDVKTGKSSKSWQEDSRSIAALVFSPDGKVLASTDFSGNKIYLWNSKNGKQIREIEAKRIEGYLPGFLVGGDVWEGPNSLAFSPDGRLLASTHHDGSVRLWDMKEEKECIPLLGHQGWSTSVAFSPSGKVLASSGSDDIILWEMATGKVIRRLTGHRADIGSLSFSRDGKFLISASDDATGLVWDIWEGNARK